MTDSGAGQRRTEGGGRYQGPRSGGRDRGRGGGRDAHRDRDREHVRDEVMHAGGRGQHTAEARQPKARSTQGLPDPEILEAYDCIVEGAAKDIIAMFRAEQAQRHQWENRSLRVHTISTILGQVLGFFIAVAIFVSAAVIGMYGDAAIGAFVWVFGMALVTMTALVWWYAKSLGQRPLFARPALRGSFRPEKDKG